MKSIQRNQGGFSLVEILLVLGIIAILAIAAFIIFPQVQASNRANTELSNITTLQAGIKNLYGATRDYASVTPTVVNQARIAPPTMNGGNFDATTLSSSWSQNVNVAPGAGTPARTFLITYTAVPSEVCTKLVPGLINNFDIISVNGAVVKDATAATPVAATPAAIVTNCSAADNVDVILTSN